jgi:hypothetical protein
MQHEFAEPGTHFAAVRVTAHPDGRSAPAPRAGLLPLPERPPNWLGGRMTTPDTTAGVDLFWIPLGAGAHVVRVSGRAFEALSAHHQRRRRCDLYHSALEVRVADARFVIEQTPVPDLDGAPRGVVAVGPVGTKWAGRFRILRYEVRRWQNGLIPDVTQAVDSPVRMSDDVETAKRVLEVVRSVPSPVWGRDEYHTGEMWNSNSIIAWTLVSAGLDAGAVRPPADGRAPGWSAGCVVAARTGGAHAPSHVVSASVG